MITGEVVAGHWSCALCDAAGDAGTHLEAAGQLSTHYLNAHHYSRPAVAQDVTALDRQRYYRHPRHLRIA